MRTDWFNVIGAWNAPYLAADVAATEIDLLTTNLRVVEYEPTNQAITKQLPVYTP
jgi:hypothetical protein